MNKWFLLAGVFSLGTSGIHVFGGGPEISAPVQASALSAVVRAVSVVCWHAITAMLVINGFGLIFAAGKQPSVQMAVGFMVLAQFGAFIVLFIAYNMIRFGTLMEMPQWILFTILCATIVPGLMQKAPARGDL